MLRIALCLIAAICASALRVPVPTTRRNAVIAGASLVPGLVLPQAAHADAIADIAAKNAAEAAALREQKAAAAEAKGLLDGLEGGFNAVLSVGVLGIIGAVGYFALDIKSTSDSTTVNNLDRNRFMTPKERRDAGLK